MYNIPSVLGATKEGNKRAAPAFSISGRAKQHIDDRVLVPGPGTYNYSNPDSIKPKSPAYSVSSRYQMPGDTTAKPGPGAYSPENVSESYYYSDLAGFSQHYLIKSYSDLRCTDDPQYRVN